MDKEYQITSGKCRDLLRYEYQEEYLDDLYWQLVDGVLYIKGNVKNRGKSVAAFGVPGWEYPFICFSDRWHSFASDVKCVSTEAGCNAMIIPGHWVFRDTCDFTRLEKVIIPEGVNLVFTEAFCDCTSICEISIPSSVKLIERAAFSGCSALSKIILPKGLRMIDEIAFCGCSSLEEIEIPGGVADIGCKAFAYCKNLKKVRLLPGVVCINYATFSDCQNLGEIIIPDTVEWIGTEAFKNCNSLERAIIPEAIKCLGADLFDGCNNLQYIILPKKKLNILTNGNVFVEINTETQLEELKNYIGLNANTNVILANRGIHLKQWNTRCKYR